MRGLSDRPLTAVGPGALGKATPRHFPQAFYFLGKTGITTCKSLIPFLKKDATGQGFSWYLQLETTIVDAVVAGHVLDCTNRVQLTSLHPTFCKAGKLMITVESITWLSKALRRIACHVKRGTR